MLHMVATLGVLGAVYEVLEYAGPAARSLSPSERFTLCNMSAELGAKTGVFPYDDTTAGVSWATGRSSTTSPCGPTRTRPIRAN